MDKKHRKLMSVVVKLYDKLGYKIEPEVYYNHYGLKGYVDLIIHTKDKHGMVIEIKSVCEDLGEIIRQLNTPFKALDINNNYQKVLVIPYTKINKKFILDNIQILSLANIKIFIIQNKGESHKDIIWIGNNYINYIDNLEWEDYFVFN